MTATRCTVALAGGTIGHGFVAGRNPRHAELAAVFDASCRIRCGRRTSSGASSRPLLTAIAHPGSIVTVPSLPDAPAPLGRVAAAICLTLVDFETPLWVQPAAMTGAVVEYLRFGGCII